MGAVESEKFQMVSANKQNMNWGYGRHACPGRFFAAVEVKIFVATVVMNYDVELKDKGKTMPVRRFDINDTALPDLQQEILFRKIAA